MNIYIASLALSWIPKTLNKILDNLPLFFLRRSLERACALRTVHRYSSYGTLCPDRGEGAECGVVEHDGTERTSLNRPSDGAVTAASLGCLADL